MCRRHYESSRRSWGQRLVPGRTWFEGCRSAVNSVRPFRTNMRQPRSPRGHQWGSGPLLASLHQFLPGGHALLVIGLVEVVQANPGETHLINGPLPAPHPVLRIRIELVVIRIVVPGGDVNDRAGGEQRGNILRIVICNAPAELIVTYATERLGSRRAWTG